MLHLEHQSRALEDQSESEETDVDLPVPSHHLEDPDEKRSIVSLGEETVPSNADT
jgi:hypothetical protein